MTRSTGAQPNENGVYEPQECLTLPRDVKGWKGMPTAEIELIDLGPYWLWATRFQLMHGDLWGSASPLIDDCPRRFMSRRAPTREAAVDAAGAYLRERIGPRSGESADARRIIAWLDELHPAQPDLFGGRG